MKENSLEEYLLDYIPGRIGTILAENPVPGMDGTIFTLQITITGERDLAFGITIRDARSIIVAMGAIEKPMIAITLPDDFLRPMVRLVSALTGKSQYDLVSSTRGSVDMEIGLPGGDILPVRTVFNGTEEPRFSMSGSSRDLGRMASGALDPTQAFMQGLIKLNGDISFALKLSQLAIKK